VTVKLTNYLEDSAADQESNREELVWVLTRTASISILVIWFSVTLWILWVDLWIFMWWIWFWIGFTLKVFLSNFIAWIVMVTQWTYHNWDLIEVNGKTWKITKIHSLFTAVEQFDWVIFYIPNVKFLEENVSNFHSNDKRRVEIEVWVDYNTDITKAKTTILQVLSNFPNILQAPKSSIFVEKLDNSSIKLNIRFWINTLDNYFETKSNVTETINLAFKKSDIHVAFPQVTISNRK
jgi:small-conductance mechanosensitive channel